MAAAAISNWYHSSLWTRSRQLQVAPLLARAEENARSGRAPAEAVVINMGDILADDPSLLNSIKPKKHETLFGPALGPVNSGPKWTNYGKVDNNKDELTQETVKAWIAKSKDPSQPTTTLQALVNLKRPSIRLSPLSPADTEDEAAPTTHHGLEFEYDLDAARGKILIEVISPTPEAPPILVYEALVDGGFAKHLKLDDGAMFELAKLEQHKLSAAAAETPAAVVDAATPSSSDANSPAVAAPAVAPAKKRFSAFHFRKKNTRRAAGPAVAVVDAQAPAPTGADGAEKPEDAKEVDADDEAGGVRVRIRIEALDETDKTLAASNAQTTYLHIVRVKPAPAVVPEGEQPTPAEEESVGQWVVKVVKREATIGLHTFHLHEIYGLASSTAPAAPSHSYPPEGADQEGQAYDFAGTECVLCLSEPREVVLLPCRHLVACKECALNMIEFGAGGQVTQTNADGTAVGAEAATTPAANPNATEGDLEAGLAGLAGAAPAPAAPAAPRRKRKAKGWFCPVCRQPYTSLLRITTTPPETEKLGDASAPELPAPVPAQTAIVAPTPAAVTPDTTEVAKETEETTGQPKTAVDASHEPVKAKEAEKPAPEVEAEAPAAAPVAESAPTDAESNARPSTSTEAQPASSSAPAPPAAAPEKKD